MVIQTFEDNKREMLLSIKKFKNTFPKPKEKKKKKHFNAKEKRNYNSANLYLPNPIKLPSPPVAPCCSCRIMFWRPPMPPIGQR